MIQAREGVAAASNDRRGRASRWHVPACCFYGPYTAQYAYLPAHSLERSVSGVLGVLQRLRRDTAVWCVCELARPNDADGTVGRSVRFFGRGSVVLMLGWAF